MKSLLSLIVHKYVFLKLCPKKPESVPLEKVMTPGEIEEEDLQDKGHSGGILEQAH